MTDTSLLGRIALVTGAGRNIGRATALELAGKGACVAVNSRKNKEECDSVRDEINSAGGKAISVTADVGVEEEVRDMFDQIVTVIKNNKVQWDWKVCGYCKQNNIPIIVIHNK